MKTTNIVDALSDYSNIVCAATRHYELGVRFSIDHFEILYRRFFNFFTLLASEG